MCIITKSKLYFIGKKYLGNILWGLLPVFSLHSTILESKDRATQYLDFVTVPVNEK